MEDRPVRRYLGLQVLRFVAAALVVSYHATKIASEQLGGVPIWTKGGCGVNLFFVLSGFVIVWSSIKLFDARDGWLIFAERRLVRVVPMYWIATTCKAIGILVAGSMVVHAHLTPWTLVASYLFIPARNLDNFFWPILGVGWTLNYEMFFYALFTAALFLRFSVFRFVGIVLVLLSIGSFFTKPWWPWPSFYLNSIVLEFYFGMLIAKLCLGGKHLSASIAVPMMALGWVLLLLPTPLDRTNLLLSQGVPAAMIIWALASLEDFWPRIPSAIIFLAEASYAIYLFHLLGAQLPAVWMAKHHMHHPWLAVVLSVLVSLSLGSIVHQFVERPITNFFRDRLKVRHQRIIHAA